MGMPKYDRLLHILNMLRARRNLNAARLAEECGVTERSIYRDIISLSEANIPIYYDNGYRLASDNFLPPLNFDFEEYNCLKLAMESSPLAKTGRYAVVLKRIRGKVDAGLSETVKKQRRQAVETTTLEIPVSQPDGDFESYFRIIEQAIGEDRRLLMTYVSIESGETERLVEPYFIVFKARAFYFVAFCHLRGELRTFRIDRIQHIELTDEHFVPRRDIDAHDYFEGSWGIYSGEPVEVVVEFTGPAARVILSATHHHSEIVEELGADRVRYRVTVNGLEEICRWIVGFGDQAEVIEPDRLRSRLADLGRSLQAIYSNNG
ncbi:MAG: YafY family transcriptional regulator [Candidatus Zixiibacteriota bacterium]|nr:MAG: YafY family transcriptional regulator [candidate division Zixibacteria bacterium]